MPRGYALVQDNEIPPLERALEVVVSYDTHDTTIDAISIDMQLLSYFCVGSSNYYKKKLYRSLIRTVSRRSINDVSLQ